MRPSISVIIVTYNGQRVIKKCLSTLLESKKWLDNIIIVDNHSTDKTSQILEEYGEQIQLISLENNIGFGQANNIGIVEALKRGSDYLLLLNQDVYFDGINLPLFLERSVESQEKNIGAFCPIHINQSREQLDYNFKTFLFKNNASSLIDAYFLNSIDSERSFKIDFANAAIWLLPKRTIEIIGGFDPIFFHYGEDRNYANRMRHSNLSIHVIPNTYAVHDRQQEDGGYKKENLAQFQFLVESTDPNANYPIISLLARIFYRNYITRTGGKPKVIMKTIKDSYLSLIKLRRARQRKKSYRSSIPFRFLDYPS